MSAQSDMSSPGSVWTRVTRQIARAVETREATPPPPVPWRPRLFVALGIGIASGLLAYYSVRRPGAVPDFLYPWTGLQLFLKGTNPYQAMRVNGTPPFDEALFYPFTALLALLPFSRFPLHLAAGFFFGLSSGALAFCITRDGLWRVHIFMSASFVTAALLVQFAPLLMVAAFIPTLALLGTIKPNIGIPLFLFRPSWKGVAGCIAFLTLSLTIFPRWPLGWLDSIRHDTRVGAHAIPLFQMGGILLALTILRWRRRAGRLLLVMSLIPQQLYFYDQLPLWLVPATRQQSIALTACSQLAFILYYLLRTPGELVVRSAYPLVIALLYLPALIILLRQPSDATRSIVKQPTAE